MEHWLGPLQMRGSTVDSTEGCHILLVHHHPSNSTRTSLKANQRIFRPEDPAGSSELHNPFWGLLIKGIVTSSIPVHLCSKPRCTAAQRAAGWRRGQERIVIKSPTALLCFNFHLTDSSDPLRAKTNHNTWTVCLGVSLSASVWSWQPSSHLRPPQSCNPTAGAA